MLLAHSHDTLRSKARGLDTIRHAGDFRHDGYVILVPVQYQAPRETHFVVGTYCASPNCQVHSDFPASLVYGPSSVGKLSDHPHGAWEDAPDPVRYSVLKSAG
jgi:hypothetical protein